VEHYAPAYVDASSLDSRPVVADGVSDLNAQRQIAIEGDIISAAIDSLYASTTKGRL
jgi:hypothetical protein